MTGPNSTTYSYAKANTLLSDTKHQYDYDRNGNLIKKTETDDDGRTVVTAYSYDYENRLVKAVVQKGTETKTITFKYDPLGRRIEKKVAGSSSSTSDDGGDKTYTYVYDNEDIVVEYLTKSDDDRDKTTATRYIHGPGIDAPLAIEQKGEVYYYHADGLGSITTITDSKQKTIESYTYDSYGTFKRKGDKVKSRYTYTAREYDEELGLYYYRARYYDPKAGRFISRDPIGFRGGMNVYNYVSGNPVSAVDPLGLKFSVEGLSGISNQKALAEFDYARIYLMQSPAMRMLIDELEKSEVVYTIKVGNNVDNAYSPWSNTITWDPYHGVIAEINTAAINPAILLAHEMLHKNLSWSAIAISGFEEKLGLVPDYDTSEEERVIAIERIVCDELHTMGRYDHGGAKYDVSVPYYPLDIININCPLCHESIK